MKPWENLDLVEMPNGGIMSLIRRDEEYVIRADGSELMSSRRHGSEESLATETLRRAPGCQRLLIGGLGLGYTLRAALDVLPAEAEVVVAELVPKVIEWNRGPLAHLADSPLEDPRVEVRQTDVVTCLQEPNSWDVILLDVDNGPSAFTQNSNNQLYESEGLFRIRLALRLNGFLTVWSSTADAGFERLLAAQGFRNQTLAVSAYPGSKKKHYLFVAQLGETEDGRKLKALHKAGGGRGPKGSRQKDVRRSEGSRRRR